LLVEKGLVAEEDVDSIVSTYEHDIGPMRGAAVVARAWTDPEYKARLLAEGVDAINEMTGGGLEPKEVVVVENTDKVHNVVVCTLCSCYPWDVLGLPPSWYKAPAYRSRVVREPRAVLSEFGVDLDPEVEIRVWDSSSEVRYLVLPQRPAGTEGKSDKELAELVTRDAMIGTGLVTG
jgi:nitrile hydratase